MIHKFFYFKCAINLNENCVIICRKMKLCPLNITFLHKFLYRISMMTMKRWFLQKNKMRKMIKISNSRQISAKGNKICLTLKKKQTLAFINRKFFFFFFFKKTRFIKVDLPKLVCLKKNYWVHLIKTHWSCFKYDGFSTYIEYI